MDSVEADELGLRDFLQETIHAAVLVAFPVKECDVGQPFRVEHLRDGSADIVVQRILACVDERGTFIVDQELVLGDVELGKPDGDAVNAARDVIEASVRGEFWPLLRKRRLPLDRSRSLQTFRDLR